MKNLKLLSCFAVLFISNVCNGQKRPNILFAIADDMSHASAYGYKFLKTPNVDKLAKTGLKFNRMYTPSSKCAPSRAVILTGRNPWQLEEAANHQPTWPVKYKSVVEVLTDNGYFTGFTGKGWNPGIHPKGRNLTGKPYNQLQLESVPAKGIHKFDYTGNFKQFMNEKPEEEPFFFWYGCKEPHRGYEFKSGVKSGKKLEDLDFLPTFWGESEAVKHDILDYAVEVEYFDTHLGNIIEHLAEIGELNNTIIIVTSDNAMPFPRYKGHPHEFATRVPFIVNWPEKINNSGREVNEFTSFIDLAPTFLEVAGINQKETALQPIEGKSLFDIFSNKSKKRDYVITGRERNDCVRQNGWGYPVRSIHRGEYVYMYNFEPNRWPCGEPRTGYRDTDWSPTKTKTLEAKPGTFIYDLCYGKRPQEELYHITKDPECLHNLAENTDFVKIKKRLKNELFAKLKRQGDPRMFGNGTIFDNYDFERRNKSYLELVESVRVKTAKKKN
ncbi:sulfatase family protein [Seonamhaeicola marinus]|uniref:Sulfatase n=1 Tax=Seonamhaeicola marinus TaxID=1912246 RepID=A0A5D0HUR1_9FLAO|nr:sulfatase [Seonamhaeicola marinus]TYA74651.1 sulfatase [Seonamhaeicola marinus]